MEGNTQTKALDRTRFDLEPFHINITIPLTTITAARGQAGIAGIQSSNCG